MATWRKLISEHMDWHAEDFSDVVSCTLSDEELDKEFDEDYGGPEGKPFTLWTKNRVYFPVTYDGAEWVRSAPRNPSKESVEHVGRW